jgi:hypothetical protein
MHSFGLLTFFFVMPAISGPLPMIPMFFRNQRNSILNVGLMKGASCAVISGSSLMVLAAGEWHQSSSKSVELLT